MKTTLGDQLTVWGKSSLTSYYDGDDRVDCDCQVRIEGQKIVVSYDDDDGPMVYQGSETAAGHYRLVSSRKNGRATLHREPGDDVLEGHWIEAGYEGMWRIQLGTD